MSVQALASALKVPVYKVQALEDDRWDELTDKVFARALALSICRLLRLPSDAVVAALPKHEAAKLASNPEGINTPYKEKALRSLMSSNQDSNAGNTIKLVAALLIAVAGAAGLYFLPQWQDGDSDGTEVVSLVVESGANEPLFMPHTEAETGAPALGAGPEIVAPALLEPALVAPEVVAQAPEPVAPVAQEPMAATAAQTPAAEPQEKPAAGSAGQMLRFTAKGESWVQVRNAQQQVLMEKILKAGDVYEGTVASLPIQVVVGNVAATTLDIDGAAFDLAAAAKNNVARFEVK